MKALAKLKAEPGIWMTDVPEPAVGHNDLKIRIRKTAICGTDTHIFNWDAWSRATIKVPMVIGHEYVGEVVEVGQEVSGFAAVVIMSVVAGSGRAYAALRGNMAGQEIHLVRQDVAVAEYQILRLVRHIGRVDQLHARLFRSTSAFGLVAMAAGGDHVHP